MKEIFERHRGQRRPLDVFHADGVEENVEGAAVWATSMPINGGLIEGIDLCRAGRSTLGRDFPGQCIDLDDVRPARRSRAPSRANIRAGVDPIEPAAS